MASCIVGMILSSSDFLEQMLVHCFCPFCIESVKKIENALRNGDMI